jgi:acetylglutamate kinase
MDPDTTPKAPLQPLEPVDAVLRFLESVGPGAEAEFYLRTFRGWAPERFATLAVLASALTHSAEGVALDLRFLRELGLTPVVVLGLYDPSLAESHRELLAGHLREAGLTTVALNTEAPREAVAEAAAAGTIPLLLASGAQRETRVQGLGTLLSRLGTHKLILLRPRGGLRLTDHPVSVVNLSTDYTRLVDAGALDADELSLLDDIRRLVFDVVPHRLLVSMTSPLDLMRELFTVRGAGTMLRAGVRIERHEGFEGVDRARLAGLLESSFGKTVRPGFFQRSPRHVYVDDAYRGAAVIEDAELGAYLSKFAVTREAQGEGVGQDLWGALTADHRCLIWRARSDNPIRGWYERQCQARYDAGRWTVYLRGIPVDRIGDAVNHALAQPLDFD